MSFSIQADGILCECHVTDSEVYFSPEFRNAQIKTEDIIGCEVVSSSWFFNRPALDLWHIVQKEDNVLMREKIQITGDENVWRNLEKEIQDKLAKLTKRPKSLLVLINPIGGKKRSVQEYQNTVSPIFSLADVKCDVHVSKKPKQMVEIMKKYDTSGIDGVVVLGGDGSFAEVANVLLRKAQEQAGVNYNDPSAKVQPIQIPITMIPTGSGNYIAAMTTGCRDITTSALHVIKGQTSYLNFVGVYADDKLVDYGGVTAAYGLSPELVYLCDVKYRWLGHIRYYAFPLRFFLFKTAFKTYNAEVTCYTDCTDVSKRVQEEDGALFMNGQKVKHVTLKDSTKDAVSFKGTFVGIFSIIGNLLNPETKGVDWKNLNRKPQNLFSTLFSNNSITASKLFMQIKEIMGSQESKEDDFYDAVTLRGLKVRVTDKDKGDGCEEDLLRHLLLVDGEIYNIKNLEFQFWLHENVVPTFTTYNDYRRNH